MKQTLTDQELAVIARIIDTATQRGIFRAAELTTVGKLFEKIVSILPKKEDKEVEITNEK